MNVWWSQTMVQGVGWTLLHFLWQGLVIAALLAIGLRLLRSKPAHLRYLAGCAALLLMTLAPLVTFQLVLKQDEPPPLPVTEPTIEPVVADAPAPMEHVARPVSALPKIVVTATREPRAQKTSWRLELLLPWLVAAWFAGVCALSCRLFAGWLQIRRLRNADTETLADGWPEKLGELARRLGVNRPLRLLRTACVEVPTVIGWLRPVILLPASCLTGLTRAQLESIIAHELAHIRRHDYLINLLQNAAETLLFYHPAVWWVSRRIREERENCCDDLVVEVCGDRVGYARALATLEELRPASAQLVLAAGGAPLLQRIRRVLGQGERSAGRPVWPLAGVLVVMLLGVSAMGLRGHRAVAASDGRMAAVPVVKQMASLNGQSNAQSGQIQPAASNGSLFTQNNATNNEQDQVNTLVRDGRFYYEAGKYDEAEAKFKQVLKLDPANMVAVQYIRLVAAKRQLAALHINATESTGQADAGLKTVPLETRTFHVDPNTFVQGLAGVTGMPVGTNGTGGLGGGVGDGYGPGGMGGFGGGGVGGGSGGGLQYVTVSTAKIQAAVRQYFTSAGVDLSTNNGKVVIFNDRKGTLTIRATSQDLDVIESTIQTLNQAAPWNVSGTARGFYDNNSNSPSPASKTNDSAALRTRSYAVNRAFYGELEHATGESFGPVGVGYRSAAEVLAQRKAVESAVRKYFTAAGLDFGTTTGKTVTFNTSSLTVRATAPDLDAILPLMRTLNQTPSATDNLEALEVRTFRVDPNIFRKGLESARAFRLTRAGQRAVQPAATSTNKSAPMEEQIRELFRNAGVELDSENSGTVVIWNGNRGTLTVRATPQDLDLIQAAIQTLNTSPPEVNIKAKFVEITENAGKEIGFQWYLGGFKVGNVTNQPDTNGPGNVGVTAFPGAVNSITQNAVPATGFGSQTNAPRLATVTGILTDPQYRAVLQALDQHEGVDVLTMPEVTTESGRQAQMQAVEVQSIVVMNTNTNTWQGTNYSVKEMNFGPILDVTPDVSADEFTVHLKLTASLTEFVGYDNPGQFIPTVMVTNGAKVTPVTSVLPLPRFRLREVTTSADVWDAQTVVVGGFGLVDSISRTTDKVPVLGSIPLMGGLFRSEHVTKTRKELMIFITPTIINPDGTRYHRDEEMPLAKSVPPGQVGTNSAPNK